jgi:rhamnosyltransferase
MTGIVIRTLNESEHIGECLDVLARQRGHHELDVVVVDSGSTDSTVEIARTRGARIVELAPDEFDYSRALNVGIDETAGDVVVSLSAHAIPVDEGWLDQMLAPFEDPTVAGVSSRQVPWPGAPWQEVHRLRHQFPPIGYTVDRDAAATIVFSNAASAVRRSVWREHPFTLPAAEDLDWAQRVIEAGWRIAYEADTAVYHSHVESPRAQALRMIDINRVLDPDVAARSRLRTVREAIGMLVRDARKILSLDDPLWRKAAYLVDLVKMVSYYVLDFSRAGTTAERRRQDLVG